MKEFIRTIREDRIIFGGFIGIFFFLFLNLTLIILSYSRLPPFIPLYNQMPWGVERLGFKNEILIPLIITVFVFISNSIILGLYYKRTPLIARILTLTGFLTSLLCLLFSIRTIQTVL